MPKFIAPNDCDLPTLGLRVKAGDVVEFPAGTTPPGDWKPATKSKASADVKES